MKRRRTICHAWVGGCGLLKKHAGTRYAKHVFLDLVGCVGLVVHSGAFGARNVDALFFMLGLHWYGFHKNHARTRYVKLLFLRPL
jgi:hypothetical protein